MAHKKIMRKCGEKLEKDAKMHEKGLPKKQALKGAKIMKKMAKKAKEK